MLGIIYQFIKAPKQTIALYSHTKQWNVWWIIIGVSGLISAIKLSSLGVWWLSIYSVWTASYIVLIALSVDVAAQLLGHRGELKSVIYWVGFIEAIYWFKPAVQNIQDLLPVGEIFVFAVQLTAVIYFFILHFNLDLRNLYPEFE